MYEKNLIILRGCSGCGKNFTADFLKNLYPETSICSADDYFVEKYGFYNFVGSEIGAAHEFCRKKFLDSLEKGVKVVVIANTNATEKQFEFYEKVGREKNYNVIFWVIENRISSQNIHNVPEISLETQEKNIRASLKLR